MSESERMASREEQDELEKSHGQHLLDVTDYAKERREDPLVEILRQAHQAEASQSGAEAEADNA